MEPTGPQSDEARKDWQATGKALSLGFSVVVSLLLCIGGGILLDRWLGTEPIFVLVGVVLGLGAVGYSFYELATMDVPVRAKRGASRVWDDDEPDDWVKGSGDGSPRIDQG
jgi:ATP synthase protein I